MIVWVNGTFGAGKTSACRELVELLPGSLLYDPELVGYGLRRMLPADRMSPVSDFQDLPSWRRLVPEVAAALLSEVPGPLVVPMTLLREDYRDEIFGALAARGLAVHHFVLDPEETILRQRIAEREECPDDPDGSARVREWCREHLSQYRSARRWLSRDAQLVDTGDLTPRQTAERLAELVKDGAARCPIVQSADSTGDTVAAAVLLFDEQDRVLLVDPVYKPSWEFPGGVVERGEAPTDAALRETAEELGLRLEAPALRLLAVDWEPRTGPRQGGLRLVYDGGRLDDAARAGLRLPAEELRGWRFVTLDEAAGLLPAGRLRRLAAALDARERGELRYLEAGLPAAVGAAAAG
ncbi:NUDIX hydrolase [Kitasatospora atroaurantiaca]|uniref:ADP-ribose pyrophosphatase YjhB (NUDIX family) n=1 Tax=Kitasatospora atroaurantiaca TaxID=285545 RepID=A0A561EKJ6_9ACTN|nr:NUDIX hydrolase [Kitasatospora atroaurantiaca]TWE16109.1 ADP-ribose pyrophosphatase YjhB (NUDIX family) [Kitasatospora atroaurantiaca]